MVPDDLVRGGVPRDPEARDAPGDQASKPRDDDAFAATIAPQPPPPSDLPIGTAPPDSQTVRQSKRQRAVAAIESEATMAAPLSAIVDGTGPPELAPLPIVPEEHYKPGEEIARGGMGRIVAAQDQRLGRPVALKELLEPAGDSLGRFQREALITARLQHPGIVPVYEAGRWPSGEPFFAMKLVSGRPLDRVIAETRTLADRLALLPRIAAAADAIAYAHSQRVVHRDLKPGNVLIGDFGETVVIDWGLAKDLDAGDSPESGMRSPKAAVKRTANPTSTAASTLTVAGAVMGTPAYMAPEQARGEPVDQRADVFALGAMLYHLLAGVPPYNARTATDVIAAAALHKVVPLVEREDATPRDLVAIVERAMAAEPANRYPHAGELADELRRFLTGQLVSAHRYTTVQRIRRYVKKHRAAVMIATFAILAFALSGTLAVRQIMYERDAAQYERSIADTRREAAEELIDKMLSDVKVRLVQIGRLDLLANLGNQIREYYLKLATSPGGMPESDVYRMAVAVELVGRAERDSGDTDRALKTWTDVREQVATIVGRDTSNATLGARAMIARLDFQIGTIYQGRGKAAAAITAYEKAKSEFGQLLTEAPKERHVLLHSAENHDRLGDLLRNDGKIDQAFEEYSEAKAQRVRASAIATAAAQGKPAIEEVLALSTSHLKLGTVYQARGDTATAFAEYRAALRLRETLLETQPDNIEIQERVLDVQDTIAELQRQTGDGPSAIQTYESALPILESMIKRDANNTAWKRHHGNMLADLGFTFLDAGEFKRGLEVLERAIANQRELVARDPKNTSWRVDLSRSYTRAGDGDIHLGAIDAAIVKYELGRELRRALSSLNPKNVPYRRSVAWSHAKLGNAYGYKHDVTRAIEAHEKALELRAQLVQESPAQGGFRNELASSEVTLGKLLAGRDAKRSAELITNGLGRARALVAGDPINNEWKETVTQGLLARADAAKVTNDREGRRAALAEAEVIAKAVMESAPHNAHWPAFLAEIHAGLAEAAADPNTARAEWKAVRDLLEPLANANRLSAVKKYLLDRARLAQ
jgi:serine/threonine protein kinase